MCTHLENGRRSGVFIGAGRYLFICFGEKFRHNDFGYPKTSTDHQLYRYGGVLSPIGRRIILFYYSP